MNRSEFPYFPGLEGVAAVESALSYVDGDRGLLFIAERPVTELATSMSFAEVCAKLWSVATASAVDIEDVETNLYRGRQLAHEILTRRCEGQLSASTPLARASGYLAALPPCSDDVEGAARSTGYLATIMAFLASGEKPDSLHMPQPQEHVTDLLTMTFAKPPTANMVTALTTYLIGICDHEQNASTFTMRVIASTGASLAGALAGALAALAGPLHGGAPGPVLDMLDLLADHPDRAGWLRHELASGRRIMGVGHRVYKVRDPRAKLFEGAAMAIAGSESDRQRLALAREVEILAVKALQEHKPDRDLHANVEFYTAVLLELLGFDRALFTGIFACGRVAGWTAHYLEQRRSGRLLRPRQRYLARPPDLAMV